MERKFSAGWKWLEKAEMPHVQALRAMELAGLEPATSWVRSRLADSLEIVYLQVLSGHYLIREWRWIAVDYG